MFSFRFTIDICLLIQNWPESQYIIYFLVLCRSLAVMEDMTTPDEWSLDIQDDAVDKKSKECPKVLGDNMKLGVILRFQNQAKIHHVVTDDWTDSMEAHVFEVLGRKQRRFLERKILQKLRSSPEFVAEIETSPNFRVIVCRTIEGTQQPQDSSNSGRLVRSKDPQFMIPTPPPIKPLQAVRNELDSTETVKLIYFTYCQKNNTHLPRFKSETFPQQPGQKPKGSLTLQNLDRWEMGKILRHIASEDFTTRCNVAILHHSRGQEHISKIQQPRRRKPRLLPHARAQQFVHKMAEMISAEPIHRPGLSFFLRHISVQDFLWTPCRTAEEMENQARSWEQRLQHIVKEIPTILRRKNEERAETWRKYIPKVLNVFGGFANPVAWYIDWLFCNRISASGFTSQSVSSESTPELARWITNLDWMIEYNFEEFSVENIASLKASLALGYNEQVFTWMRRISTHVRMHKWATNEIYKEGCDESSIDPALLHMIASFTSKEIIVGMTPLIEQMLVTAASDVQAWRQVALMDPADVERESGFEPRWIRSSDIRNHTQLSNLSS